MKGAFWQLVLDNEIAVIGKTELKVNISQHFLVVITKLVENNGVKADQYWPDEDDPILYFENNINVMFKSELNNDGLIR